MSERFNEGIIDKQLIKAATAKDPIKRSNQKRLTGFKSSHLYFF